MTCCGEDGVMVSKMALELKSGPMLLYKRRVFGKDWRDVYAVLYNDSTLAWYKDKSLMEQEGGVVIKDSPELMAYSQFTNMIPNRPELPEHYSVKELLAFGTRGKEHVYWVLCPTDQEVISWVTAISNTLPPPPQPVLTQQPPFAPMTENNIPQAMSPSAPPSLPPAQYAQLPTTPAGIPGQYPQPSYLPPSNYVPPYTARPLQPMYPYVRPVQSQAANASQPSNTTVVVQDRRNDGGGDFAMGMLVGGAIGTTWGWGYGRGWGGGGGWHSGQTVQDTDIHINNYYDVDNTVVNNNVDIDASHDVIAQGDIIAGDFDTNDTGGADYDAIDFGGGEGDFGGDFGF